MRDICWRTSDWRYRVVDPAPDLDDRVVVVLASGRAVVDGDDGPRLGVFDSGRP